MEREHCSYCGCEYIPTLDSCTFEPGDEQTEENICEIHCPHCGKSALPVNN